MYHPAKVTVYQEVPELERRLSELQSQIDRLGASMRGWPEGGDSRPPDSRLSELTEQCAEIVQRWAATGERHAHAVGEFEQRLAAWNAAEVRGQEDVAARMRELQRIIEQEWGALRNIHEEPIKQLREQAANLTQVCVATASSALSGFDRAETRLAGLETGVHRHLTELSEQVQSALAEFRSLARRPPAALDTPATSWPLEGVVRLHNQLRESGEPDDDGPAPLAGVRRAQRPDMAPPALSARIETLERAVTEGQAEIRHAAERHHRAGRLGWIAAVVIAAAIVGGGFGLWQLQQQVSARVTEAEQQAQHATQAANQQIAAARDEAARQMADARAAAMKAQTISDVLAAPDLVRFNLAGRDGATPLTGQALWSRTRGLVLSGSRLPVPPAGSTYQVWLTTGGAPVSAGVFVPDAAGRFTFASDKPTDGTRPISGAAVTIEPAGGRTVPTGPRLLARVLQQP